MTESSSSAEVTTKTLPDVLSFWFPKPGGSPDGSREYMNDPSYIGSQMNDWFFGGDAMDEKSRAFRSLIRSEGAKHSASELDKNSHEDLIAKIVLFDQIVRNAFRADPEAFAYEDQVKEILEYLLQVTDDKQTEISEDALSAFVNREDVTFCDCYFVGVALSHQEKAIFHGVDIRMYDYVAKRWPDTQKMVDQAVEFAEHHVAVLRRFGRYPHRNEQKGRESTPEEQAWLDDYDNLPGWAKSQLTKKE
ncbi:unnamed protein product [Cylindrotheca closterium]|uniref:DUF924 domain-containing protein n=1 Tax=Cylindrotheca closterium TaxID=2856 RepID=A0AAD2G1J8_9STRA|nr:unnamed protein product [Cylindrotheca closterium]